MKKKAYSVFIAMMLLLAAAMYSAATALTGTQYVTAAGNQSVYKLTVANSRGMIYDCNLKPLVNTVGRDISVVAPTIETIGLLEKATKGENRDMLKTALEDGKPFVTDIRIPFENEFIDTFRVPARYSPLSLAPHLVGYADSLGNGISGIELAMDDLLSNTSGEISVYYQVDALGRVIPGAGKQVVNTLESSKSGVVLTIDSNIQREAQKASALIDEGAVVVTHVETGEIKALASFPEYDRTDMEKAINTENAPLVNRAFSAYAPGSVFKLVTAAAELESGPSGNDFVCTGSVNSGGMMFRCINGIAHGELTLGSAIVNSCNCYFINSARSLGGQTVLATAYNMGFGVGQEFGRGLFSSAGVLPDVRELTNSRALSNFAFGQGTLSVTPLQVAGMVNAIAADGEHITLSLISAIADNELNLSEVASSDEVRVRIMKKSTALRLQSHMISTVLSGTGVSGAPEGLTAGAKTGTAQTGIYDGEDELLNFWYTGFLEDEFGPEYTITVLSANTPDDKGACAKVFKELAEYLGGYTPQ